MKTQVDEQTIQDLFDLIKYSPKGIREVLTVLLDILPLIEEGNEGPALEAALEVQGRQAASGFWKSDGGLQHMREIICELSHYRDKRSVVEAALAKNQNLDDKSLTLEQMLPEVKAAFGNLDQRTKELFGVFKELMSVSGRINTDFANEILEVVTANPLILRNEKKLAVIVKAYDMARPINQAM